MKNLSESVCRAAACRAKAVSSASRCLRHHNGCVWPGDSPRRHASRAFGAHAVQRSRLRGRRRGAEVDIKMILETLLHTIQTADNAGTSMLELRDALASGQAISVGQGELLAKDAAATFRIRQKTTERAKTDTSGFADVLLALGQRPSDERITLFHFSTADQMFTVFTSSSDEILGCIRVTQRNVTI